MSIDPPTRPLDHPDVVLDCEEAMEPAFHAVHDARVTAGESERDVAQALLVGADDPDLAQVAVDAVSAGWPVDIARRALLSLARNNVARVDGGL